MQLNLELIHAALKKTYPVKRYGPKQRELCYRRPALYEQGKPMEDGLLYIARCGSLPESLPGVNCGLICIGQRLPQVFTMYALPVLLLKGEFSAIAVWNAVNEVFDDYESWDLSMRDALEREEDFSLEEMMRLAAQRLPYRISVVDSGLQPMFVIEEAQDEKGVREVRKSDPGMSVGYTFEINKVCHLERTIRVPYLTGIDLSGQNYCNNIYMMDHFVGCVSVGMEQGTFRECDYPLMDLFFSYFRKAFVKYLRRSARVEKPGLEVFQKLLNRTGVSDRELEELQGTQKAQWALFVLRESFGDRSYPRDYMRSSLNAISADVFTLVHRDCLTGLLRLPETAERQTAVLEQLSGLTVPMGYLSGISNAFEDLRQLYTYLPQAVFAAAKAQETGAALCRFDSCALDYMLDSCLGGITLEAALSPGLQRLREQDASRGTEYVRTLYVYLCNEMAIVHTAQALYIHRSSLLKRLEKIQRILEDDLQDPRHRMYYRLCLELIQRENR